MDSLQCVFNFFFLPRPWFVCRQLAAWDDKNVQDLSLGLIQNGNLLNHATSLSPGTMCRKQLCMNHERMNARIVGCCETLRRGRHYIYN